MRFPFLFLDLTLKITKDLVGLVVEGTQTKAVNSIDFIKAIRANLEKKLK